MRVICKTFDDFLTNLRAIATGRMFDNVRVSISEMDTHDDGTKFEINFQASALIHFAGFDGQYLLEFGEMVGRDIRDSNPDSSGTEKAQEYKRILQELCDEREWTILPGVISI